MNLEKSVKERYSRGALERQEALCCPVDYETSLLSLLPEEVITKDYGCGDPSRYVREDDVVLDLGCGGGKICYMAAQLVGAAGEVIGVDMNDDMLALARKYQPVMSDRLGGERVRFVKGYIQDLALDLERLERRLEQQPVRNHHDYAALKAWEHRQRREQPMIADASVDLVISNCVLNLVSDEEKQQLVAEIHRVLKPGGRIAISDIVSDRQVPDRLKQDALLWSGCISGAFQEHAFLEAFAGGGFEAVRYDKWDPQPWRVVDGIEFRSATLTAVKTRPAAVDTATRCIIYRGPFASVTDDRGRQYPRGVRVEVPEASHAVLTGSAYEGVFIDPVGGTDNATACCSTASSDDKPLQPGNGGCC